LGTVIDERQVYRHRVQAGYRIGDGKRVDLFRYVAWLVHVRREPKPKPEGESYEALKERARARNAALSLAGRDIGDLPDVVNPKRKKRAAPDFRFFCESYFPTTFSLPWSDDHVKIIGKIERAVLHGGLFAMARSEKNVTLAYLNSSATQQRKNMPRRRRGRLAIDCSFRRVRCLSSSFVLAWWDFSSWCFRWFQTFSSGFQSGEYFGK